MKTPVADIVALARNSSTQETEEEDAVQGQSQHTVGAFLSPLPSTQTEERGL